jgi:hypothetical protein
VTSYCRGPDVALYGAAGGYNNNVRVALVGGENDSNGNREAEDPSVGWTVVDAVLSLSHDMGVLAILYYLSGYIMTFKCGNK